jgi:hypothetical protein
MAVRILNQDTRNWIQFLKFYATSRCTAIQPGFQNQAALLLFNGPKVQWGFPTLAIELDFVLTEERETVRSVIAQKLKRARYQFRRKPS